MPSNDPRGGIVGADGDVQRSDEPSGRAFVARQYQKTIVRKGKAISKGKRIGETQGEATIREGKCPKHDTRSTTFVGVNASGWIFRCAGGVLKNVHYYVNRPPGKRKAAAK